MGAAALESQVDVLYLGDRWPKLASDRLWGAFSGCESIAARITFSPSFMSHRLIALNETDRLVVDYSSVTNPQFKLRRHESNPGHNEENLQYEQKEVHDRSPVFDVDGSDQWVRSAAERSENEAFRSHTIMIGATGDLFPAGSSPDHAPQ
jgi:hypothetical protein